MEPVARFHRAAPGPLLQILQAIGKGDSEEGSQFLAGPSHETGPVDERIPEVARIRSGGEFVEDALGLCCRSRPGTVGGQKDVDQRDPALLCEALAMSLEMFPQFRLGRLGHRIQVFHEKAHLLEKSTAHDRVALVQPDSQRFAEQNFILEEPLDERRFLLRRRRKARPAEMVLAQSFHMGLGNRNTMVLRGNLSVKQEDRGTDCDKLPERLSAPLPQLLGDPLDHGYFLVRLCSVCGLSVKRVLVRFPIASKARCGSGP